MADVNRQTVDYLVLHHAMTPTWENKSKAELAQWFSDNGFYRGYEGNPARYSGLINPYTGAKSYSQAQYAGQMVNDTTPDATDEERKKGFRLVELVVDPFGEICWHAGNWDINTRSIGIEILGDFRYMSLRENDCKVIADFWRPQDRALGGATAIVGHKEVSTTGTECPANIMNSRDHIVELVNANDSGWALTDTTPKTENVTPVVVEPEQSEIVVDDKEPILEPTTQDTSSTKVLTLQSLIDFIVNLFKKLFNIK